MKQKTLNLILAGIRKQPLSEIEVKVADQLPETYAKGKIMEAAAKGEYEEAANWAIYAKGRKLEDTLPSLKADKTPRGRVKPKVEDTPNMVICDSAQDCGPVVGCLHDRPHLHGPDCDAKCGHKDKHTQCLPVEVEGDKPNGN